MIGGRLLRGKHFQAGVLGGHLVADFEGRPCTCGGVGCVEAEASTWALPELCREAPGFAASALARGGRLDFEALFACAAEGDAVAVAVRDRCLAVWAAGAVAMVHAWDPEVLVVGGGVMRSAAAVLPAIEAHVHRHAWTPWGKVAVRAAALGERAALARRGAAPAGGVSGDAPATTRSSPSSRWGLRRPARSGGRRSSSASRALRSRSRCVLAVECYPGVHVDEVRKVLTDGLRPALVVDARQAYKDAAEVERMCAPLLGDDPVFGRMNGLLVADFVDPGARGGPARPDRQGAHRPGARRGDGSRSPRRAGRPRLRGPRALGDPAAPAAGRGGEPRGPRPEGAAGEALQAGLLRGLAGGRPPEAARSSIGSTGCSTRTTRRLRR